MRFILQYLLLALLLSIAAWVLFPGTAGGFMLDDQPNLAFLSAIGKQDSAWQACLHALGQISGATRSLPNLTFVWQAHAWPAQPGQMIVLNIAIHLLNGALVYFLARKIAHLAGIAYGDIAALLVATIWLLHPIQVSATLYIIQRFNQLSATFVFAGLLIFLHGRQILERHPHRAVMLMTAGVAGGTLLAALCKENGVLLPLLALVLEVTLLKNFPVALGRLWRQLFLITPQFLLIGSAVFFFDTAILPGYGQRDFTLSERLMTEAHVLLDYLRVIAVPRAYGLGLFHDDFAVIRWPLSVSEFCGVAIVVGLPAVAFIFRRRWPLAAFGVLWFIAAHSLEASILPLELYFEHRNYLPLFGPVFSFVMFISAGFVQMSRVLKWALMGLVVGWVGVALGTTRQLSVLWGEPAGQAAVWAHEHPKSARALAHDAGMNYMAGFYDAAGRQMARLTESEFSLSDYYPSWLAQACSGLMTPSPDLGRVRAAFSRARYSKNMINGLSGLAELSEEKGCRTYEALDSVRLIDVLAENPEYRAHLHKLLVLRGRFNGAAGRWQQALSDFQHSQEMALNPEVAFLEVRALLALGRYPEATGRLNQIEAMVLAGGVRSLKYRSALENWRKRLIQ